ncbi:MAG: hypothetical protein IJF83_11635 [Methanobrevibacter sp.]|nr:hypothetical protein [Methanobrevibacter sp.]
MIECPNCDKSVRDSFTYCRFCGSKMNGEKMGDFTTDMLNVFRVGEDYLYLFAEKGSQVVLKAGSMDELASIVLKKKYPWEFRDWKGNASHTKRDSVEIPEVKTEFLKASALKEVEIIPSSSAKKKKAEDESYVPDYEVEEVRDDGKNDEESDAKPNHAGEFKGGKDYVESIEDVGFGKIMDRNLTGCVPTVWGPDTSQRARELRASIFR